MSIDSIMAERENIKKQLKELEEKEKRREIEKEKILNCIKATLDKHKVKYSDDSDEDKIIGILLGIDNKVFSMKIILQDEKVIFILAFPFRVQSNSVAIVALYMAQFNVNKAFSEMNMDLDDGEVTIKYSYLLGNSENFDEDYFWTYMIVLIYSAKETYTILNRLAVGKVSIEIKTLYKTLLEQSLAVINEEEDDEVIKYLKHLGPECSNLLNRKYDGKKGIHGNKRIDRRRRLDAWAELLDDDTNDSIHDIEMSTLDIEDIFLPCEREDGSENEVTDTEE